MATLSTGAAVTLSVAVFVTPPKLAEIVTIVGAVTVVVATVNVAVVDPAATVTLAGTAATVALLLARLTTVALDGAALSVTVPRALVPPATLDGLSVRVPRPGDEGGGGGFTVKTAHFVTPAPETENVTAGLVQDNGVRSAKSHAEGGSGRGHSGD